MEETQEEYVTLNCAHCKEPLAKIHKELLGTIRERLNYQGAGGPHLYHVCCPGGFESDVLELTQKLGREPNIDTALHILQWELGDLTKSHTYMKWHPGLATSYKAEAKLALSSLLFQAHVVAALLDASPADLLTIGIETVQDRIEEKEKKVGRFQHYVGDQEGG